MPKIGEIKKKAENRIDLDSVDNTIRAKLREMREVEKGYNIVLVVDTGEHEDYDDMPILENSYTTRFLGEFVEALNSLGYDDTDMLEKKFHIWEREGSEQVKIGKITVYPRHYPIKVDE
jgi:hypothetical protein